MNFGSQPNNGISKHAIIGGRIDIITNNAKQPEQFDTLSRDTDSFGGK
jgi:hypothetical protein